jgi:hypothetical protein
MTLIQRNSGTFNGTTFNVAPSAGSFGTGTVLVIAVFGNTVVNTPAGWTQRSSSVVAMGLYSYDKTGAGEASIAFTNSSGVGEWFVWELSAGSTYDIGNASQVTTDQTSYATPSITPTAGARHLFAVGGGIRAGQARTVTSFSGGFTEWADLQVTSGDWPFSAAADLDVTANGSTAYTSTATFSAITSGAAGGITLAYVNNAGDTTSPSVPTGLATTSISSTSVGLQWNASTDDVGVTGYEVQVIGQ